MKIKSLGKILTLFLIALTSCTPNSTVKENVELNKVIDSLQELTNSQSDIIHSLRDSIGVQEELINRLQYPAPERLSKAKEYFETKDFGKAQNEIDQLKATFPNSPEIIKADELAIKIKECIEAEAKERERKEALGFKALPEMTSIKVGYNLITLSSFTTGSKFVFDSYDDTYHYFTADKDSKYITFSMSVKSTDKNPAIPLFAIYSIKGKEMNYIGTFQTRYSRWSDFGAFLGNYNDTSNDFSKVNTVNFKLGAQIKSSLLNEPYAIVMVNDNVQVEKYERFNNPPKYWTTDFSFPETLNLDSFHSRYVLIKIKFDNKY